MLGLDVGLTGLPVLHSRGGSPPPTYVPPDIAGTSGLILASTGDLVVTVPAETEEGHILVLIRESNNQAAGDPSGWTPQGNVSFGTAAATSATRLEVWTKVAGASESSVTFTALAGGHQYGIMLALASHDGVDDWEAAPPSPGNPGIGGSISWLAATSTVANARVIDIVGGATGGSGENWTTYACASLTDLEQVLDVLSTTGDGGGVGIFTGIQPSAGAVSAASATSAVVGGNQVRARLVVRAALAFFLSLGDDDFLADDMELAD